MLVGLLLLRLVGLLLLLLLLLGFVEKRWATRREANTSINHTMRESRVKSSQPIKTNRMMGLAKRRKMRSGIDASRSVWIVWTEGRVDMLSSFVDHNKGLMHYARCIFHRCPANDVHVVAGAVGC